MISYRPFWDTLKQSQESTYSLIKVHRLSSSTIDKLRKNKPLTTTTINELCCIFHCDVDCILEYVETDNEVLLSDGVSDRNVCCPSS